MKPSYVLLLELIGVLPFMFLRILIASTFILKALSAQVEFLPTPPTGPSVILPPPRSTALAAPAAPSWFDTSNRATVRDLYNGLWTPSRSASIGWTGDVAGCLEGTTQQAWKDAVTTGLTFLRNLAGISGSVGLDLLNSASDQKAALMFSANNQLSHAPPTNWTCYSAQGASAAGNSNICLSSVSLKPGCLELYMVDSGSNNSAAGHRRWILYPQTQSFGSGDIPVNGSHWSSNALWVFDGNYGGPRPTTREPYVAWPSKGYFPYQLVPVRWSFSYAGASFAAATVSVTRNGSALPVLQEVVQDGYGENTLVWYDATLNSGSQPNATPPSADIVYAVTINNVIIGGAPQSFTYPVIVFDPATAGAGQPGVVSLSPQTGAGASQNFTFSFSDPAGYTNLDVLNVLINPFLDGRQSCYLAFSRPFNILYLMNDAGTALLPGLPLNGTGSVSNSYCSVTGAGTSSSGFGNILTLTLNMAFNQVNYGRDHVIYAAARNLIGGNSGWVTSGTWRVPSVVAVPTVFSVVPGSGSGTTQAFTITFRDPAGATNISNAQVLIRADLSGNYACYLGYVRAPNLLYLVNDANSGLLPAIVPNSGTGSAQNNQCILTGSGTTVVTSGTDLILTVNLTFKPAFSGAKVVYTAFQNVSSFNTGWQARALWTVP